MRGSNPRYPMGARSSDVPLDARPIAVCILTKDGRVEWRAPEEVEAPSTVDNTRSFPGEAPPETTEEG